MNKKMECQKAPNTACTRSPATPAPSSLEKEKRNQGVDELTELFTGFSFNHAHTISILVFSTCVLTTVAEDL